MANETGKTYSGLLCSRECFCHQCLNWDNRKYILYELWYYPAGATTQWWVLVKQTIFSTILRLQKHQRVKIPAMWILYALPVNSHSVFYFSCEENLPTFLSNCPHTAAPLPAVVVIGTTKLYTEEFIQGKFITKGSNNRYLPISQVKLITLTLIITTDTEYSCEPTWSPGGTCSGIGEGSDPVGSHLASKLPQPG